MKILKQTTPKIKYICEKCLSYGVLVISMSNIQDSNVTLESLYVINKKAKQYSEKSVEAYESGNGKNAKKNSERKEALYDLKTDVINEIKEKAEKVELHRSEGFDMYCMYFDEFSFHVPANEIGKIRYEDTKVFDEFEVDSEKEATTRSLKDSLLHIQDEFGFNANDYLSVRRLRYISGSYFVGWTYLEEAEEDEQKEIEKFA